MFDLQVAIWVYVLAMSTKSNRSLFECQHLNAEHVGCCVSAYLAVNALPVNAALGTAGAITLNK